MTQYSQQQLQLIVAVWQRGRPVVGQNPSTFREDDFGNLIRLQDYGNRDSVFGWEIDHIIPTSRGGSDALPNLRPLHWRANSSLGGRLGR